MGLPERLRIIDLTPAMTKMDNRRLVPICDRLFDLLQPLRRDSGPVISLKKPEDETARLRRVTGIPITPGMTTEDSGKNQKAAAKCDGSISGSEKSLVDVLDELVGNFGFLEEFAENVVIQPGKSRAIGRTIFHLLD
jgi:hypothetical protein